MPQTPDELTTLTLRREHWDIILYLAIRGGNEALETYVRGQGHTANCMVQNANAVRALHDLLHPGGKPLSNPEVDAVH